MEDVEARFTHLLQPIRDLTKNWEVDVAAHLGEYLEELDQICISFDEGKTTMNFIEAALLIQGSACVYSKKVEYLYSLVYQALDFISGKRSSKQLPSEQGQATSCDLSSGASQVQDEFLSLDKLPYSQTNLYLRASQEPTEVLIIPLLPMSLVAPDELEKKQHPLYSCKGEILASRKDYRMNTSTPHVQGTFMLEPQSLFLMETLRETQGEMRQEPGTSQLPLQSRPAPEEQPMDVCVCASPDPGPVPSCPQDPGPFLDVQMPGEGGEDDDVGLGEEAPSFVPLPETKEPGNLQQMGQDMQPRKYQLRERNRALEPAPQLKIPDPWQSLDPFDSTDSKLFKKGRPFSVPPYLEEVPGQKRKKKGAPKLQNFHQWYLAVYANNADSNKSQRKGLSFADMEVLYWKHVKEQLDTLRRVKRQQAASPWLPGAEEPVEEDRGEDPPEDLGDADDFLEAEECVEFEGTNPEDVRGLEADAMPTHLSYEELVRKNVEMYITSSQKFVQETELSQRIRDWEDMVQPRLQEQEQHVAFDIHTYEDQVISSFSQLEQWCPFAKLVEGQPAFEVCRSMLASLQLANDYTVEIRQQPGLEAAVDTMSLRLLTQQRAYQRFQTYTAPSMAQP